MSYSTSRPWAKRYGRRFGWEPYNIRNPEDVLFYTELIWDEAEKKEAVRDLANHRFDQSWPETRHRHCETCECDDPLELVRLRFLGTFIQFWMEPV